MANYGKKRGRASRVAPDSEAEQDDEPQQDEYDQNEDEEEPQPSKGKGKAKIKIKAVAKEKASKARGGSGKGKARQVSDDEEEDDAEVVDDDEGDEEGEDETTGGKKKGKGALSVQEKEDLVKEITRHVLFSEYSRKLHTRADIVKTVLPDGKSRYFNELIPKVQKNLRKVLGMELVALRPRENSTAKSQFKVRDYRSYPRQKQCSSIESLFTDPAKVYALRSTLPIQLIRASAALPLASISSAVDEDLAESSALARELINYAEDDDDGDLSGLHREQRADANGGYIRDVKREEGAAYGILGVILALILVNGKVLGDDQLITYLRRLSLYPSTIIPLSPCSSHPGHLNLDHLIQLMCKQGYLERSASGAAPAGAAAAAARTGHVPATQRTIRGKGADLIEGGDAAIEYRWGARAEVEIGEAGVAQFIQTIFEAGGPKKSLGGNDNDDEEEDKDDGATERRKEAPEEKKRKAERLMIELKRAAGTVSLQDAAEVEVTL